MLLYYMSVPTCNRFILIEQYCLGKTECTVPVDKNIFDKDGNTCPGIPKTLSIQVHCGHKNVRSHMRVMLESNL